VNERSADSSQVVERPTAMTRQLIEERRRLEQSALSNMTLFYGQRPQLGQMFMQSCVPRSQLSTSGKCDVFRLAYYAIRLASTIE
jgi:hypothetical protein